MEEKTPKNRRSYLDDYVKAADGTYMYTGQYRKFAGTEKEKEAFRKKLILASVLVSVSLAGSLSTLAGEMSRTMSVAAPLAAEVIFSVFCIWYAVKLLRGGDPMKAYICDSATGKLPVFFVLTGISALAGLVLSIVFLCTSGGSVLMPWNALYTAVKLLSVFSAVFGFIVIKGARWGTAV